MRACRHCAHSNADHLSFCSQCGRWLGAPTGGLAVPLAAGAPDRVRSTAAFMRTMVATPRPGSLTGSAATVAVRRGTATTGPGKSPTGIRWAGDAIGYIYVYLRDKLDAGERRRRLIDERAGAEALLTGAVTELASKILREGIQHPDFTGLLEAIGRAHARREAAAADLTAADTLQTAEAARLTAQEEAAEAEWRASDKASRDADEILRGAADDRGSAGVRLSRVRDERARLAREMTGASNARAAQLAHETVALADEQRALEELTDRLDRQLADLRDSSNALRAAAGAAKAKLDQAVAARRAAASAMAASIAGRQRDRALAEREAAELTEQLGRAAADIRPPHGALLSTYQTIDRLTATIADRSGQIAAIEAMQAHYDQRKLLTGVGLLTSLLGATAAAIWAVLR
jgi:peptidoglycan hydrolase CwlO-like protein